MMKKGISIKMENIVLLIIFIFGLIVVAATFYEKYIKPYPTEQNGKLFYDCSSSLTALDCASSAKLENCNNISILFASKKVGAYVDLTPHGGNCTIVYRFYPKTPSGDVQYGVVGNTTLVCDLPISEFRNSTFTAYIIVTHPFPSASCTGELADAYKKYQDYLRSTASTLSSNSAEIIKYDWYKDPRYEGAELYVKLKSYINISLLVYVIPNTSQYADDKNYSNLGIGTLDPMEESNFFVYNLNESEKRAVNSLKLCFKATDYGDSIICNNPISIEPYNG